VAAGNGRVPRCHLTGWVVAHPVAKLPDKATAEDGGVVVLGGKMSDETLEFELPDNLDAVVALRLEVLPHEKNGGRIARAAVKEFDSLSVDLEASLRDAAGKETKLTFARADADHKEPRYENGYALLGITKGWSTSSERQSSPQTGVYNLAAPLRVEPGSKLAITLKRNRLGAVRVSVSPIAHALPPAPDFAVALREQMKGRYGRGRRGAADVRREHEARRVAARAGAGRCGPTSRRAGRASRRRWSPRRGSRGRRACLPRGNWQDESGPVVQPAPPHFLPPGGFTLAVAGHPRDAARSGEWIVAPENPLTSRTVGTGSGSSSLGTASATRSTTWGAQGEWPSHPELLVWLAVEFREPSQPGAAHGWDVKHVVRLIVNSSTYRQASNLRPELRETDPANRLLSAQSPRRLEAEFVRDNALFAAGLLNLADIGGPSAKPYQPAGYYENIQFPDREYVASPAGEQYRRGVYSHWQRTFLHPMLANFDAPSREDCTAVRVVSNTPQQALTLLNDPSFVEAARALAAAHAAERRPRLTTPAHLPLRGRPRRASPSRASASR
jgi:hypothetical protein